MKQIALLAFFILCIIKVNAQTPDKINYQAVARDNTGSLITNTTVSVQFIIHNNTNSGPIVYSEVHNAATNAYGLFNVKIGTGTPSTGIFANINWANGDKYLQVKIDPNGGNSFIDMGTQQLVSVPYSLHSKNSRLIQKCRIRLSFNGVRTHKSSSEG